MKLFLSSLLLLSTILLSAQTNFDLKNSIPQDPKVSKGVLENGMTYYVRSNENPKNRAELFLVVKAGSIDEDDDQQGLAHFAEHMAFNGTKNFPKHELISYFESIGMEFGPKLMPTRVLMKRFTCSKYHWILQNLWKKDCRFCMIGLVR